MKIVLALVLSLTFISNLALAGCEDGPSMAEDAVMAELAKKIPNSKRVCRVSADDGTPTSIGETYSVVASCNTSPIRRTFIYSVELREVEDAVCVVKSVIRIGENG